jgi:hypothetical protein
MGVMKMRLIDADKINVEDVIGGKSEFANDIRAAMKDLIDEQSTAYDVDKVVEEIQTYESSEFIRRCYDENLIYKDAAIDIVKRGGVNDNKER